MSLNPYDKEFSRLTASVSTLGLKISEIKNLCDCYDPARRPALDQAILKAEEKHAEEKARVEAYTEQQRKLVAELKRAEAVFEDNKWSVKGWFSGSNSAMSRARDQAVANAANQYKMLKSARENEAAALTDIDSCRQQLQFAIEHYGKREAYRQEISECERKREELLAELKKISAPKEALDRELKPTVSAMDALRSQMNDLRRDIQKAERLESARSNARTSKDKWEVRKECEQLFGKANPSSVVTQKRKALEPLERDLRKHSKHATTIVRRHTMMVDSIVIDGSNLCYSRNDFIGIMVVATVANHLAEKHPVTVVFDASIRRKLGMGDDEIRAQFSDKVKVHVVATRTKADSLVLKEAAGVNCWVISNDRFVEFVTEPVVSEDRIIRHEITEEAVYIAQLGLELSLPIRQQSQCHG
ncbi:Zc3h12a-like ribonuclease protein [Pseudomonas sp. GV085]|nr:Zc3h12a-like ribonuclease protein [Pseudomonas sp. GV085]